VAFYCDVLGMTLAHRAPGWASLEFFGARIGLQGPAELPGRPYPAPPAAGAPAAGPVLTLRSTDLDADLDYLRRRGVAVQPATEHPFGRLAVFHDSEGNRLMLMQPPPTKDTA
jgi:catechol 2,3-dioxygenase-like lactoylglutathione lyase family enzyme